MFTPFITTMTPKLSVASILSLAAYAVCISASATDSHSHRQNERALQASVGCLKSGTDAPECCPAADPNDGICTLLHCMNFDGMTLNDECTCEQIETSCRQLSMFAWLVRGWAETCSGINHCCVSESDGGGTTSNEDFDDCIRSKIDGGMAVPDFSRILPKDALELGIRDEEIMSMSMSMSFDEAAMNDERTRMLHHRSVRRRLKV
mmetsp:Transcript_34208/g.82709  ORF Transcript_34208/g.82709 Transcript_34208/m.82709 type:complete len:206 (-) Transcript_34208:175-792(-)